VIVSPTPRAERQINAGRKWWLQNRDKAPDAFDEEIERSRRLLQRDPFVGVPVITRRGKRIRRLTLERIRYYLYYRVTRERLEVISLWHTSRRPPRL